MTYVKKASASNAEFVKFATVGDNVAGVYLGAQYRADGRYGPEVQHLLKTKSGVKIVTTKPGSDLANDLKGEEGKDIQVTFESWRDTTKGRKKIYSVGVNPNAAPIDKSLLLEAMDEATSGESDEAEETEDEDSVQTQALAAVERQARMQSLLNSKGKSKN